MRETFAYVKDFIEAGDERNDSRRSPCPKAAPTSSQYFDNLTTEYEVIIILSILLSTGIVFLFIGEAYCIFHYVSSYRRAGYMIWLAGIFPITAVVSTIAICIPRAVAISNMFTFLYFSRTLFTFIELIIDYFGGRVEMAKELAGQTIKMNVPPCCCFSFCLSEIKPSPRNLRRLGTYVYQTALINPVLYFIDAIVWMDHIVEIAGDKDFLCQYIIPILSIISLISTMVAMYGTNLYVKMSSDALKGHCLITQVRIIQVMLLLYNLQSWIFAIIASTTTAIDCDSVLPESSKAELYDRFVLVVETFILSLTSAYLLRPKVNSTFDLHPERDTFRRRKPAFSFSDPRPLHHVRGSIFLGPMSADERSNHFYHSDDPFDKPQPRKTGLSKRRRSISNDSNGYFQNRKFSTSQRVSRSSSSPNLGNGATVDAFAEKFSKHNLPESILEMEEEDGEQMYKIQSDGDFQSSDRDNGIIITSEYHKKYSRDLYLSPENLRHLYR